MRIENSVIVLPTKHHIPGEPMILFHKLDAK
jgi:hypothetical protein